MAVRRERRPKVPSAFLFWAGEWYTQNPVGKWHSVRRAAWLVGTLTDLCSLGRRDRPSDSFIHPMRKLQLAIVGLLIVCGSGGGPAAALAQTGRPASLLLPPRGVPPPGTP